MRDEVVEALTVLHELRELLEVIEQGCRAALRPSD